MASRSYPQRVGGAPLKWCRFLSPLALENSCRPLLSARAVNPWRSRSYPLRALASVRVPYLYGRWSRRLRKLAMAVADQDSGPGTVPIRCVTCPLCNLHKRR